LHLVVGAGEFLGSHVSIALAGEVPIIELSADIDDETLADAMTSVDVVHLAAQTWSPARRLRYGREPAHLLKRVLSAAQRSGVRRMVHLSSADVYGPDHFTRISEKSKLKPVHVYERLKLQEERWLFANAGDVEIVVVRPARVFGRYEDFLFPYFVKQFGGGRAWIPNGGRAVQTFIAAEDVGRACLAAAERGRPGDCYLVGGFDSTWRELLEVMARNLDIKCALTTLPYDLAFLRALIREATSPPGAISTLNLYELDAICKPHFYDDSKARRQLTWSPVIGSFDQAIPRLTDWLQSLPGMTEAKKLSLT
jgi:nucleoside-diphosphate-sugar epimerase